MTITKVYQVVGVRFKEYELFKMVLETHEEFRTSFLESVRDDRHDITIDDMYSLLNDLIEDKKIDKKIDKKCKCKKQKKDRASLVEETSNLIPDVIDIIHNYDIHLCKRCIRCYVFDYIVDSMYDLKHINLPNRVKIVRFTHDVGSEDFIVGCILNEKDSIDGVLTEDIIENSKIVTETIKSIGWDIDPKPRVYMVQNDCSCCS